MPSFENVCEKVFAEKDFLKKFLIGGALSMVPVLSLVYFVEVARQLRFQKKLVLPDWENYFDYWKNGYKGVIVFIVYFGVPWILGWLLSEIIKFLTFGGLGFIHYFPLLVFLTFAPAFCACGLYLLVRDAKWTHIFDVKTIFIRICHLKSKLIFPTLIFWGAMFLGVPLYGFVFFLGFLIYMLYTHFLLILNEH